MKVWMMISNDRLQLPLAVGNSAEELARIVGVSGNTVRSAACHYEKGRKKFSSYIAVEIEEDNDGKSL